MELIQAIRNRRSIRRFLSDPVPREVLEYIFGAAMEAPSPKNSQPWHFIVFEGKRRDTLVAEIFTIVENGQHVGRINEGVMATVRVIQQAPVIVLAFNRATARYRKEPYTVTARIIDVQSIGASIQNLLLATHECGLGALWICDLVDVLPIVSSIREFLKSGHELVATIAIGYPGERPERPPRRPLVDAVCWR